MAPSFEWVTDARGRTRKVRTAEEKARRRAQVKAGKDFREKVCVICGQTYTPKFQYGTKRWESSKNCGQACKDRAHNSDPAHKQRRNAARRGNSELHRREYLRRIAIHGGTRWQLGSPRFREQMRQRNRDRFARLYGVDASYTEERRANAAHQRGRRTKAADAAFLTPDQVAFCKRLRQETRALAAELGVDLHVDHIRPLRRGGAEHPDNLLPMTAAANLFWGDRIKRCPWPKPENWEEPAWEPPTQG